MAIPGTGIVKGFATTLRNFFSTKVTRQYPETRPQMSDRWRGRLDLIYDPFGEHKCEVCFQCAMVCPVEAIDMSGFDSRGNRIRYGMPEIYDEREGPERLRGVPAWRPGRCATPPAGTKRSTRPGSTSWSTASAAEPEALVAIFSAVEDATATCPSARCG